MFHCPNCGGQLRYDIVSGRMKCGSCDSGFSVAEAEKLNTATGENGMNGYTYTCPNCGGELFSVDITATTFCSFCGSSVLLEQRLTQSDERPDRIIPFRITKEQCIEKYKDYINRMFCVDRRMIDNAVVDSFRAIYVPFCSYHTETHGELVGEASETRGDKEYIYRINGRVDYDNDWQLRDLSIALPDDHAERINEFSREDSYPFSSAYLAGFYADLPDVRPEIYLDDVMNTNAVEIANAFYKSSDASPASGQLQKVAEQAKALTVNSGSEFVLVPVWFLSFKHGDRVCYAMVNGVTGTVTADLPVDFTRFFIRAGIVAVVCFALLAFVMNLVLKPNATLATASVVLAMIVWIARGQYQKLAQRENEAERLKEASQQAAEGTMKHSGPKAKGSAVGSIIVVALGVIGFAAFSFTDELMSMLNNLSFLTGNTFLQIIGFIAMAVTGAGAFIGTAEKRKTSVLAFLLTVAAFLLLMADLPYDLLLYAVSLVMFLCGVACEYDMIGSYNKQCSNAIPVFDTHKGGEDHA